MQGAIKLKCSSSLLTIYWQSSMVNVFILLLLLLVDSKMEKYH